MIRRFQPEDAPGVVALVRETWGERYLHRSAYDPSSVIAENEAGRLGSVVALDTDGTVVGHYALENPDGVLAETGQAMVSHRARGQGLMVTMREALIELAREWGLRALWGHPVTHHPFSQKSYHSMGAVATGLELSWAPDLQVQPGRTSVTHYFQLLGEGGEPARKVALPPEDPVRSLLEAIAPTAGLALEKAPLGSGAPADCVWERAGGLVTLACAGIPRPEELARARDEAEVISLELSLTSPALAEALEVAREGGFRFSAWKPLARQGKDILCMQWLKMPVDLDALVLESPLTGRIREHLRASPPWRDA